MWFLIVSIPDLSLFLTCIKQLSVLKIYFGVAFRVAPEDSLSVLLLYLVRVPLVQSIGSPFILIFSGVTIILNPYRRTLISPKNVFISSFLAFLGFALLATTLALTINPVKCKKITSK